MKKFTLEIITPQRRAFSQEVDMVTVPTEDGTVGVLAHHERLFTILTAGEVKITQGPKEYFLAIGGGFMQVDQHPDRATILVSRAVHAEEINETAINQAIEKAKEAISNLDKGEELSNAQALLRRSLLELKVSKRRRRSSRSTPPQNIN